MDLLVESSLEHPTLPQAEARAVLDLVDGGVRATDAGALMASAPPDAAAFLARRLALAHAVHEHWASAPDAEGLATALGAVDLEGRSFAVRVRRLEGRLGPDAAQAAARRLGAVLGRTGRVDLAEPEVSVRVLVGDAWHAGRLLTTVDRAAFEARHVKVRPHFSPVSLHPRLARVLVNLARVREGDRVLDPFCGTGGTALEAAEVGARVLAGDLDPAMVAGTERTLTAYGATPEKVEVHDVGDMPQWAGMVDAIVTDPPFGRNAATGKEGLDTLYDRFFSAAAETLRPGGRLTGTFHDLALVEQPREGLVLEETHPYRVHKSLTRTFAVWRRPEA